MFVIDPRLRISQCQAVLTEPQIREELLRRLAAKEFSGKKVADHLRIAPARITEMKKGERFVQRNEMVPLAQFLGLETDPSVLIPSEDEMTEMLAQIQAQMPAMLPSAEWPRYVAEALRLRLDTLSNDRSKADNGDRQA